MTHFSPMTMQIGTWSSTEPDIRMDHHHQTQPMYIQQNPSQVLLINYDVTPTQAYLYPKPRI